MISLLSVPYMYIVDWNRIITIVIHLLTRELSNVIYINEAIEPEA